METGLSQSKEDQLKELEEKWTKSIITRQELEEKWTKALNTASKKQSKIDELTKRLNIELRSLHRWSRLYQTIFRLSLMDVKQGKVTEYIDKCVDLDEFMVLRHYLKVKEKTSMIDNDSNLSYNIAKLIEDHMPLYFSLYENTDFYYKVDKNVDNNAPKNKAVS